MNQQDSLRNKLMNETSDDRIKDIINRFIVQPKINGNVAKSLSDEIQHAIFKSEQFIMGYVEQHTNFQIK